MSQFYARYIPPSSKSTAVQTSAPALENRKRKAESEPKPKKKKQKFIADDGETEKDEATSRKSQPREDVKQRYNDTKDAGEATTGLEWRLDDFEIQGL